VREPVVLCHGMGANRFNLDLNETYSVARYLAGKGYETLVVELRGNGITRNLLGGKHYRFTFDDLVEKDLPALVGKAKELAGSDRVLWVGHSKGGVVMYAWCGSGDRSKDLAGVVAIGSPLIGERHFPMRVQQALSISARAVVLDAIYAEPFLRVLAPAGRAGLLRTKLMADSAHIDPDVAGWAMTNLLGNVSAGVAKQFLRWLETGKFTSLAGFDYRAGLASSRVPFQLLVGAGDLLAPPHSLENARDAMKKADVDYVLCGRAQGFAWDYGHGDLVLGRSAPKEIFPRIEAWLKNAEPRASIRGPWPRFSSSIRTRRSGA